MQSFRNNTDLDELKNVLATFPEIEAAFLFGSTGTDRMHRNSDLDLALDGDLSELRRQRLDILTELARAGFGRVDLVLLREAPPALAFEAVKAHRVVYYRPDASPSTIFSNTIRRYFDIRPLLECQAEAYKQRLLHSQT